MDYSNQFFLKYKNEFSPWEVFNFFFLDEKSFKKSNAAGRS